MAAAMLTRPPPELSPSSRSSESLHSLLTPPPPHVSNSSSHLKRPLSPSSLPHVVLHDVAELPRKRNLPPPPSGHDLMAIFPPQPPTNSMLDNSRCFFAQERAFFAIPGREIIRFDERLDTPMQTHMHSRRQSVAPASSAPAPGPSSGLMPPMPLNSKGKSATRPGPAQSHSQSHTPVAMPPMPLYESRRGSIPHIAPGPGPSAGPGPGSAMYSYPPPPPPPSHQHPNQHQHHHHGPSRQGSTTHRGSLPPPPPQMTTIAIPPASSSAGPSPFERGPRSSHPSHPSGYNQGLIPPYYGPPVTMAPPPLPNSVSTPGSAVRSPPTSSQSAHGRHRGHSRRPSAQDIAMAGMGVLTPTSATVPIPISSGPPHSHSHSYPSPGARLSPGSTHGGPVRREHRDHKDQRDREMRERSPSGSDHERGERGERGAPSSVHDHRRRAGKHTKRVVVR